MSIKIYGQVDEAELSALLVSAQDGDRRAYETFLGELYRILERYLWRRVSDKSVLPDVVQEIVVGVHKARHTYDPTQRVFPWLMAIARYKTIDYWKRRKRDRNFFTHDEEILLRQPAPGDEVELADNQWLLEEYLDVLPQKQRDLVSMVKLEGHSVRYAAEFFGMTESNVKTTVHRAIKKMRERSHATTK